MSSRVKQVLPVAIMATSCLFFCFQTHAADPTAAVLAGLKFEGKVITILGSNACQPETVLEIELPTSVTSLETDFRAVTRSGRRPGDTKTKVESLCPSKFPGGTDPKEITEFHTPNYSIPMSKIILPSACRDKDKDGKDHRGQKAERIICIYGEPGKDDLIAYAPISYNTEVARLDKITTPVAINGTVTFKGIVSQTADKVEIETCYILASKGHIDDEENCPEGKGFKSDISDGLDVKITGLKNYELYHFKVGLRTKDQKTKFRFRFSAEPVPVAFPLDSYDGPEGAVGWNCQQTSSSSLIVMMCALLAMWLVRLRARPSMAISLVVLCFVIMPTKSHADLGQMNFAILGSMYRPNLDGTLKADGSPAFPIYSTFFKKDASAEDGPINPLMGFEIDWHLFDDFGSLQLGVGIGYTYLNGHAVKIDKSGKPNFNDSLDDVSASLHMYQIRPQLTYLFNPFAEVVPLVPYVRGALIAHGYSFFQNDKNESSSSTRPNGMQFGYQAAVGLMLMMDFLEPSAVAQGRSAGFMDHVYLKGELSYTKINSFGAGGFDFSAKDVMGTSLPLMWTFGLVFEMPE